MNSRALPILNAMGCLALTGLVVVQWRKERTLDGVLASLTTELSSARAGAAEDARRNGALERDLAVLKDALAATQQSAQANAHSLAENVQSVTRLNAELAGARDQVASWRGAVTARDARIRTLDAELVAARHRLDEAIVRLKAAVVK